MRNNGRERERAVAEREKEVDGGRRARNAGVRSPRQLALSGSNVPCGAGVHAKIDEPGAGGRRAAPLLGERGEGWPRHTPAPSNCAIVSEGNQLANRAARPHAWARSAPGKGRHAAGATGDRVTAALGEPYPRVCERSHTRAHSTRARAPRIGMRAAAFAGIHNPKGAPCFGNLARAAYV